MIARTSNDKRGLLPVPAHTLAWIRRNQHRATAAAGLAATARRDMTRCGLMALFEFLRLDVGVIAGYVPLGRSAIGPHGRVAGQPLSQLTAARTTAAAIAVLAGEGLPLPGSSHWRPAPGTLGPGGLASLGHGQGAGARA